MCLILNNLFAPKRPALRLVNCANELWPQESKSASQGAGATGTRHDITQKILYAQGKGLSRGNHCLAWSDSLLLCTLASPVYAPGPMHDVTVGGMVEEEDGRGEAGTARLGRLGNTGAFRAHGRGGGCFGVGRALVPAARGVLGTDHNHCDYTIVAGSGAEGILAAFRRNGAWSGTWRDCRESLRAACSGVWR